MEFIYYLLIGLCAGWLASQIMKGGSSGMITNLIVGVIGAILGGFVFGLLGLVAVGLIGNLVTATVGACLLIFLLRKFGGSK
ncbi:GlsB/YeaQ/YmgE family stress response membrane protein [Thalassoglobus sp.]|uniref:GlsB/YeaQ/YmgE family stress response membrane protein n=1 Tax=Thalassoglobus sp. TaxID=2795869 RepID=UPI003AA9BE07